MTEQALAVRETFDLNQTMTLGKVLAESGFFSDARQASQAVVKVLAGRELGFGPIASMTGVHIVQGKPVMGANLIGAAIKSSSRYNYHVVDLTDDHAEVAFFENGSEVGRSRFTMADAKAAGLTGKAVWKQYPRNMLFSRAISNGARWYCPDVFSGVTPYTPEELGAEVSGDGDIIDVTPTRQPEPEPKEKPQPKPKPKPAPKAAAKENSGLGSYSPSDQKAVIEDLLATVNAGTDGHYKNVPHLFNACKELHGKDYKWPHPNHPTAWGELAEELVKRVLDDGEAEAQEALPL